MTLREPRPAPALRRGEFSLLSDPNLIRAEFPVGRIYPDYYMIFTLNLSFFSSTFLGERRELAPSPLSAELAVSLPEEKLLRPQY
jgi:hypothetical protein